MFRSIQSDGQTFQMPYVGIKFYFLSHVAFEWSHYIILVPFSEAVRVNGSISLCSLLNRSHNPLWP